MSDSAERNGDGDASLKPEGTNSRSEKHCNDEWAAMKAKINSIWEELKGKDSLPAKVGLPKVQKVSKPSKPSKSVPEEEAGDNDEVGDDSGDTEEDPDIELTRGNFDRSYLKYISGNQTENDIDSEEEEEDFGGKTEGCLCSYCCEEEEEEEEEHRVQDTGGIYIVQIEVAVS